MSFRSPRRTLLPQKSDRPVRAGPHNLNFRKTVIGRTIGSSRADTLEAGSLRQHPNPSMKDCGLRDRLVDKPDLQACADEKAKASVSVAPLSIPTILHCFAGTEGHGRMRHRFHLLTHRCHARRVNRRRSCCGEERQDRQHDSEEAMRHGRRCIERDDLVSVLKKLGLPATHPRPHEPFMSWRRGH